LISYLELQHLLNEILSIIRGARIANVYHLPDDSIILKLRKEATIGELRIIPGKALYFVGGSYEKPRELDQRGRLFRDLLSSAEIIDAEVVKGERIAVFRLRKGGSELRLVCELLPRGTIAILDDQGRILASLHNLEMRDRRIIPGELYKLPPPRPTPSAENLLEILQRLAPGRSIVAALASDAGLGGRYAEELLHLAGIDPGRKVRDLSQGDFERIISAAGEILKSIERGPPVIAYSPDGGVQALPYPMKLLGERGWRYQVVETLNDAVRMAYEHELAEEVAKKRRAAIEERIRELEKRIREKRFTAQRLLTESSAKKRLAEKLFQHAPILDSLRDRPGSHVVGDLEIQVDGEGGGIRVRDGDLELELDPRSSIMKQISSIFDESKRAREAAEKLLKEAGELEEEAEDLRRRMLEEAEEALLRVSARIKRGGGRWYERYRWFLTSEGFLVVAGRDASSNMSLLKKHLEADDLVFHAEVRGAAAVILKRGKEAGEQSLLEAAQFAAVYSRAWKEGIGVMTVYYVEPHQISFTPPPGHYLPRGGFIIKGERRYLTVKLELAIGVSDDLRIVYGPPSSVARRAGRFVKIVPGDKRGEKLIDEIAELLFKDLGVDSKTLRDLKVELQDIIPGPSLVHGVVVKKGREGERGGAHEDR